MQKKEIFILTILFCCSGLFFNCGKSPEITPEIVIVKDTVFVTQTDTLLIKEIPDAATFFFVRHAEKLSTGLNPNLSQEGKERANELARLLGQVKLDAVYSTNYNRTIETATPTATEQNLTTKIYNPNDLNAFGKGLIETYPTGKLLVVGHSNTTPQLINSLTTSTNLLDLPEEEYDNLFIVTLYELGNAEVLLLKYGE